MDHYIDIRLLADPEFVPGILMNALGAKLHRALVRLHSDRIGISFPERPLKGLGMVMRLHGTQKDLNELMKDNWLLSMRDHVRIYGPEQVPAKTKTIEVRRKQVKSSSERILRRLAKRLSVRKNISYEAALNEFSEIPEKSLDLPFLQLKSQSTKNPYRLFIEQKEVTIGIINGKFNSFGLSQTATLPWF